MIGNRLLLGTNEGGLVVISVDLHEGSSFTISFVTLVVDNDTPPDLQIFKFFAKKALVQLYAVEQFNILISLAGINIMHEIHNS